MRGYARAKRATLSLNQHMREAEVEEQQRLEARERNESARRIVLRGKALRDVKGWTGEYKVPDKKRNR